MRHLAFLLPLAVSATPLTAANFDLPPRKAGQWEMSIETQGAPAPQLLRMCLDAESDKLLNARFGGMASQMCSRQEQRREGDQLILDSDCKLGDMTSSSHTVITGSFDTGYTMRTEIEMGGSNAPQGIRRANPQTGISQVTTIDARRVGECEASFKPGDIDLGGGKIMNVRDIPQPQIQ